jgi:AcrR family transcriptional regulator
MASIETKAKILAVATQLFNKKGVADITLRDIAEGCKISIGNLAYHFKNKDAIILEIFQQMEDERKALLSKVQFIPTFENIHEQVLSILKLSLKYKFFHVSTLYLVRSYPSIAKLHRLYIESHIQYIKAMLDYSVGVGNLQPEPIPGYYERMAELVWITLHFWLMQEEIRGSKGHNILQARQIMWEMVYPHLTEKGLPKLSVLMETKPKKAMVKSRSNSLQKKYSYQ